MTIKSDHDLIQQVLDGSISHENFKAFQMRMRNEPELLGLYREYALLHHSLCEEFEGRRIERKTCPPRRNTRFPAMFAGIAAAAAVVLLVTLLNRPGRSPRPHPVAQAEVVFSDDAVWSIKGDHFATGQKAKLDRGAIVRLQQGQARLTLGGGAAAVIDGNTELEYVSDESLRLGHGRGRFRVDAKNRHLAVSTAALTAVDLGTEFGMLSHPGKPDEVHVFEGRVQVNLPLSNEGPILAAGDAARVLDRKTIERMPVAMPRFPATPPDFTRILEDRFDAPGTANPDLNGRNPQQGLGVWRVENGAPKIGNGRLEGGNFTAFCKLPARCLSKRNPVLLATLETTEPFSGRFHTAGWAGMSFYKEGRELLFFGDGFGEETTWSIDVKQGLPVLLPENRVVGQRTVTLCYNRNTGAASLHEGSLPLGPAFVTGTLPAGIEFDEIRIGASEEAVLALRSLTVRTGESGEE